MDPSSVGQYGRPLELWRFVYDKSRCPRRWGVLRETRLHREHSRTRIILEPSACLVLHDAPLRSMRCNHKEGESALPVVALFVFHIYLFKPVHVHIVSIFVRQAASKWQETIQQSNTMLHTTGGKARVGHEHDKGPRH